MLPGWKCVLTWRQVCYLAQPDQEGTHHSPHEKPFLSCSAFQYFSHMIIYCLFIYFNSILWWIHIFTSWFILLMLFLCVCVYFPQPSLLLCCKSCMKLIRLDHMNMDRAVDTVSWKWKEAICDIRNIHSENLRTWWAGFFHEGNKCNRTSLVQHDSQTKKHQLGSICHHCISLFFYFQSFILLLW